MALANDHGGLFKTLQPCRQGLKFVAAEFRQDLAHEGVPAVRLLPEYTLPRLLQEVAGNATIVRMRFAADQLKIDQAIDEASHRRWRHAQVIGNLSRGRAGILSQLHQDPQQRHGDMRLAPDFEPERSTIFSEDQYAAKARCVCREAAMTIPLIEKVKQGTSLVHLA